MGDVIETWLGLKDIRSQLGMKGRSNSTGNSLHKFWMHTLAVIHTTSHQHQYIIELMNRMETPCPNCTKGNLMTQQHLLPFASGVPEGVMSILTPPLGA